MRRTFVLIMVVLVSVGLSASPAAAQEKVRKDKVGDAPPQFDVRTVRVQNNAKNYALSIKVGDIEFSRTVVGADIYTRGSRDFYLVSIPISGKRHATRLISYTGDYDNERRVKCKGLKATWNYNSNKVRFVVPQKCFGKSAGTFKTEAAAADKRETGYDLVSIITTRRG